MAFNPRKEYQTIHGLHEAKYVQDGINYRADFSPVGSPVKKSEVDVLKEKIAKLEKQAQEKPVDDAPEPKKTPVVEETAPLTFNDTKKEAVGIEPINTETCKRHEMIVFLRKAKKPFDMKMKNPQLLELCKEVNDGLES